MRVFRKAYRDIAVCRHERKKKNTETEPILRLVLPTGGGPSNKNVNNNACKYYTHVYSSGPSYSKGNCNLIQV